MRLLRDQPVTWSGKFRSPLDDQFVSPPIPAGHIPTWVGVGGSPHSVIRAARYGLPLMLAVIGGRPERFAPYVELYKRALEQHGQPELPVGLHSLGFVAATDEEAIEIQWPYYQEQFESGGARARMAAADLRAVPGRGRPRLDVRRLARRPSRTGSQRSSGTLSLSRFDLHYAIGRVPHEQRMAMIELFGREVIPRVRELLAATPARRRVAVGELRS